MSDVGPIMLITAVLFVIEVLAIFSRLSFHHRDQIPCSHPVRRSSPTMKVCCLCGAYQQADGTWTYKLVLRETQ